MMVPDGRMDSEKLEELLGNPEDTHLDLKAEVDLDSTEGKLKFTKDVVAMSNRPPGGYILIGVDDNETPMYARRNDHQFKNGSTAHDWEGSSAGTSKGGRYI